MNLNRKTTNGDPRTGRSRDAELDAAISAAAASTPIAKLLIEQGRSALYLEDGVMVYVPATGVALPERAHEG